jgi:hypothetical protein
MKYLMSVILLSIPLLILGCVFCGPQAELTINLRFTNLSPDSTKTDSIFVLNALDSNGLLISKNITGMQEYPISLRADSTTYVFKYENRKKTADTLTLFYEREFRYKGDCGFIVNANKPSDGRTHRSTFKDVEVRYGTYIAPNSWEVGATDTSTGIYVDIKR